MDFMEKPHVAMDNYKKPIDNLLKTKKRFTTGYQHPFCSYPQPHKMRLYHKTHRADDDDLMYIIYGASPKKLVVQGMNLLTMPRGSSSSPSLQEVTTKRRAVPAAHPSRRERQNEGQFRQLIPLKESDRAKGSSGSASL